MQQTTTRRPLSPRMEQPNMQQTTTQTKVAEGAGPWLDGAPLSVPSALVLIDIRAYRRVRCAGCGKRGMKALPQHRGERYRGINDMEPEDHGCALRVWCRLALSWRRECGTGEKSAP
jgi:hypothetical protein